MRILPNTNYGIKKAPQFGMNWMEINHLNDNLHKKLDSIQQDLNYIKTMQKKQNSLNEAYAQTLAKLAAQTKTEGRMACTEIRAIPELGGTLWIDRRENLFF